MSKVVAVMAAMVMAAWVNAGETINEICGNNIPLHGGANAIATFTMPPGHWFLTANVTVFVHGKNVVFSGANISLNPEDNNVDGHTAYPSLPLNPYQFQNGTMALTPSREFRGVDVPTPVYLNVFSTQPGQPPPDAKVLCYCFELKRP